MIQEATIDLTILAWQRTSLHKPRAVIEFLRFFNYSPLNPITIFLYCPNRDCCDEYCTYFRIVKLGNIAVQTCYDEEALQKYFIDMYNELFERQINEKISETEVENRIINFFANFKPTKCMLAKPSFKVIKIRVSDAVIWLIKYPDEFWR